MPVLCGPLQLFRHALDCSHLHCIQNEVNFLLFFACFSVFGSQLMQQVRQSSKESTGSSDSDSSSDDESTQTGAVSVPVVGVVLQPDKIAQQKETEAGAEISALVNYVQPVHFTSFEVSESEFSTRTLQRQK